MSESNELDGIKQLLDGIVNHLQTLTTQIGELRALQPISPEFRKEERMVGQSLHATAYALRQLADKVVGNTGERGETTWK